MNKLIIGALAFVVLAAGAWYLYQGGQMPTAQQIGQSNNRPGGGGGPGGATLSAAEKAQCGYTATVTEGPYYVSGAPALTAGNLDYTNLSGNPLAVSGYVYEGLDNTKPVANATIDIWQADPKGSYHPNSNGAASKYTGQLALRGTITTDAKGHYEFTTVYPGEYTGRARHIHIKVRAPGFNELTTQLIFALEGDALSFDEDTVSQGLPNCALLSANDTTPPTAATFDFRLEK